MTRIYLIRHAEAEGNLYRRVHGWYDSLITDNGYRQIAALRERFLDVPVDAVYSSDKFRTLATAEAISLPRRLTPIPVPGLREVNMGRWEDRPWGELARKEPELLYQFNHTDPAWRAPDGESCQEAGARAYRAVRVIARRHSGQTVCCVSHGTAIRQLVGTALGIPPEERKSLGHSDNTAVSCLEVDGDLVTPIFLDDNSHLDESISTLARQTWWKRSGALTDANLWYRPLDLAAQQDLYRACRREAWKASHGTMEHFDGEKFLADALEHAACDPAAVQQVMLGDRFAGILQLNLPRQRELGTGWIPFYYLTPEMRSKGLGVQLMGQAASVYRRLGRTSLRLRCARSNTAARHFYEKYGFRRIDEVESNGVTLDIMEKYIGYQLW